VVLTDTQHKADFAQHCEILKDLLSNIELGVITTPLWNTQSINDPSMNNPRYVKEYILDLLSNAFSNLSKNQIIEFISRMFSLCNPNSNIGEFKNHIRDFLVEIKEFSSGDENSKLYEDEKVEKAKKQSEIDMLIPGMIPPHDPRRDNEDIGNI